ncbi:MAG: DUF4340 domain-containing protein [Desulfovibrionaceae bacterium]|nr:DUF4340 domain-containing protein [Desulfovibrionaceae bacterium]
MKTWWGFIGLPLALVLLALGVYYFGFAVRQGPADEAQWPVIEPAKVAALEVRTPTESYVFEPGAGAWLVRPLAARPGDICAPKADLAKFTALLNFISANRPKRVLGPFARSQAEAFGLAGPGLVLRIVGVQGPGKDLEFSLGKENPSGEGVYALSSLTPDILFLLDKSWLRQVDHPMDYYHDLKVFEVAEDQVARMGLKGLEGLDWEAESRDGKYFFLRPDTVKDNALSEAEVKLYLHNLLSLKASRLESGRPLPGQAALLEFALWPRKSSEPEFLRLFQVPGDETGLLGQSSRQPCLFEVGWDRIRPLVKTAFELKGRSVVSLNLGDIELVRVTYGQEVFEAEKTETGWRERSGKSNVLGIDLTLWRFTELQFEAEPGVRLPTSALWSMTCELQDVQGKVLSLLSFYEDKELPVGQCWLRVGSEDKYYPVSNQLLNDLKGLFLPNKDFAS